MTTADAYCSLTAQRIRQDASVANQVHDIQHNTRSPVSSCIAGRHSDVGMQTSQPPASASGAGLPPGQSVGKSTQHPSNTSSSQGYHQAQHLAAKPDCVTQAGVSVGLGRLTGCSSAPKDLVSIDLTTESDENSK